MKMVDLSNKNHHYLHTITSPTTLDCTTTAATAPHRLTIRSLLDCLLPYCLSPPHPSPPPPSLSTLTFFGHRRGRVSLSLQPHPSSPPLLLLHFSLPTSSLAKEMQHGLLRLALESTQPKRGLLGVESWRVVCNGRKVGFAVRREGGEELGVLRGMEKVSAGAGVVGKGDREVLYLRAGFRRVVGSAGSESFHMIDPVGQAQMSVFFLRS